MRDDSMRRRQRTLHALMTGLRSQAADIIARGEQHAAILVLLTATGVEVMAVEPPPDEPLNATLRRQLRQARAWGYVFVDEAWVTSHVRPIIEGTVASVVDLPRDDRDEEVIMIGAVRGGPHWVEGARIEATPTGRRLGPWTPRRPAPTLGGEGVVEAW